MGVGQNAMKVYQEDFCDVFVLWKLLSCCLRGLCTGFMEEGPACGRDEDDMGCFVVVFLVSVCERLRVKWRNGEGSRMGFSWWVFLV